MKVKIEKKYAAAVIALKGSLVGGGGMSLVYKA